MNCRWVILFFTFSAISMEAQISISAGFVEDTVVIGNNATFRLSLEIDEGVEILAIPTFFIDSIYSALQSYKMQADTSQPVQPVLADLEWVSKGGFEDANGDGVFTSDEMSWEISTIGSKRLLQNAFTLKLWDPGPIVLLYPPVLYSYLGNQEQWVREEQFEIFVAPPQGVPIERDSLQIAPIKSIREEVANLSDFLIVFIVLGLLIVSSLIYFTYIKFFKKSGNELVEVESETIIPAHEIALKKLNDLKLQKLWQHGDIKMYQSELTHIIREYLEARYEIPALESTTNEVIRALKKGLLQDGDVISVQRILQVADLVKFAKATPEENIHEAFMDEAVEFVERTKIETEINNGLD